MAPQIEASESVLKAYRKRRDQDERAAVDRPEIVAHATLSALAHHFPSRISRAQSELLDSTMEIKSCEQSRWMTQRRIAIAKLTRAFDIALGSI